MSSQHESSSPLRSTPFENNKIASTVNHRVASLAQPTVKDRFAVGRFPKLQESPVNILHELEELNELDALNAFDALDDDLPMPTSGIKPVRAETKRKPENGAKIVKAQVGTTQAATQEENITGLKSVDSMIKQQKRRKTVDGKV